MKIVASIQARLGSTRLPGKVLYNFGESRLLQWPINQAKKAETIDQTIAAIGDQPENEAISEYCERSNIEYFIGAEDDLLSRHLHIAEQTNCDLLVRITADCPLIPPDEIDRVIKKHLSHNGRYTTNVVDGMPTGIGVDAIDPDLLTELQSIGETHPVKLARNNPQEWGTVWAQDTSWREVADAHLAVDTPSDYWSLVDALDAVGDEAYPIAEWLLQ